VVDDDDCASAVFDEDEDEDTDMLAGITTIYNIIIAFMVNNNSI
jgi:hypothetical protein